MTVILRCNGCAWGSVCPRATTCALKAAGDAVPWQQRPRDWNIHDARAGWRLLHCDGCFSGEFPFFVPINPAAALANAGDQLELL